MTKREMAWMIAGILAIGMFLGVALSCFVVIRAAEAEGDMMYYCWSLCRPGTEILVRSAPGKRAEIVGAVGCGAQLVTDYRETNGYIHLIDLANETGEGWIYAGYVVYTEPEIISEQREIVGGGRVACRKYINGKRTSWAKEGSYVTVYAAADGWAVTDRGYIQTRFIGGAE